MSVHQPDRPTWRCTACAADWPCPNRQRELVRDHGTARTRLGLAMARDLGTAMTDLPEVPVSALYQRFLGWVRDPPGGGRPPKPAERSA
jgi:hypothetical protein